MTRTTRDPQPKFIHARSNAEISCVRELFIEYGRSLNMDLCFDNFDEELAALPGPYGEPDGEILLARCSAQVAGCVAFRKIGDGICEMKRLYVRPAFRGKGIGAGLVRRLIEKARARGYAFMRLDTLPTMKAARSLYRAFGFVEIAPYKQNPVAGARFMELKL